MEWLRCNRCYRKMQGAKRSFSLTQCGHVFCGNCMDQVTKNCSECGSTDLGTMPLSYPPKYETTQNYFSYLDEFMAICQKNAQFQENQLSIAMRGFDETEQKYEKLKRSYWVGMEEANKMEKAFQQLKIDYKEDIKTRDALLKSKDSRSISSNQSSHSSHESQRNRGRISTSNELPRVSSLPYQTEDQRNWREYLSSKSLAMKKETPKQAYNSKSSLMSGTSDGHLQTTPFFTSVSGSSSNRSGVFLVPNTNRVPKSAASYKRTTPTKPKSKEISQ